MKNKGKNKLLSLEELQQELNIAPFQQSEGEIVVKNILSSIFRIAFNELRVLDVYDISSDYIFDKLKNKLTIYGNLVDLYPQIDNEGEIKHQLIVNPITSPNIDSWASNKTAVVQQQKQEQATSTTIGIGGENFASMNLFLGAGLAKPLKKKNRHREVEDLYKNNMINDVNSLSETTFLMNNKTNNLNSSHSIFPNYKHDNSQNITNNINTSNNNTLLNNKTGNLFKTLVNKTTNNIIRAPLSKNEQLMALCEYEDLKDNEVKEEEDFNDDKYMLIKKYRKMFEEREKDRAEKDQAEKDIQEKQVELEKNKKKFLEELSKKPIMLNFEGQIVKIKAVNQDKLAKPAIPNDRVKLPKDEEQEKIRREKEERFKSKVNTNKNENNNATSNLKLDSIENADNNNNNTKKARDIEQDNNYVVLKFGPTEIELPINYFQPNPLTFYDLSDGVEFEFYGKKKKGNDFPSLPDKMNKAEFKQLLLEYGSKLGLLGDDKIPPIDREKITDKDYSNMSSNNSRNSEYHDLSATRRKLNTIFNEDEIKEVDELVLEDKKQKKSKKQIKNFIAESKGVSAKQLYDIKKKQKSNKREDIKGRIKKEDKDFNLDMLESINDERLNLIFNDPNQKTDFMINNSKPVRRMPKKVHINDTVTTTNRNRLHKNTVGTDLENFVKIKEENDAINFNKISKKTNISNFGLINNNNIPEKNKENKNKEKNDDRKNKSKVMFSSSNMPLTNTTNKTILKK